MQAFNPPVATDVTNASDDREPIHQPGSIQPHGLLFVLDDSDAMVTQVSDNTNALLGLPPGAILGQSLKRWLGDDSCDRIVQAIDCDFESLNPIELYWQPIAEDAKHQDANHGGHHCDPRTMVPIPFTGIAHRSPQGVIILELEPATRHDLDFSDFYRLSKPALNRIQNAENLEDLCDKLAQQVRQIAGFDRVMVYRFDHGDQSGIVIAEDRRSDLNSYLGLRYPAADVPTRARTLYRLNPIRAIVSVDYTPAVIIRRNAPDDPAIAPPLDLSFSVLRSVSPCHRQYLKNMGVAASTSISLLKNGQLWGLIACHHETPRFVPYSIRTVCEFLGQVASIELGAQEERQELGYRHRLQSLQRQFIDRIAETSFFANALTTDPRALMELAGAGGVALVDGDTITCVGKTPSETWIDELLPWLDAHLENNLFVSDVLPKQYAPALDQCGCASGLLALAVSRIQRYFVLWFRPEKQRSVSWAGNPDEAIRMEMGPDGSMIMMPRNSFATWQEIVKYQSAPWRSCEIDGAIELRSAIVSIALKRADDLSELNLELQRSNSELDAFTYIASHDLREPLRGIHNYSTFLLEDYGNLLDEAGVDKLQTLVRLTQRMDGLIETLLRFSRLGRRELRRSPVDLRDAIATAAEVYQLDDRDRLAATDIDIRCIDPLPVVFGDRVLLEEVFSNLIGNALKYNENEVKHVEISCPTPTPNAEGLVIIHVRDNGIGIRPQHQEAIFRIFKRLHGPKRYGGGTGAGLTIVRKIIERHGGTVWLEPTDGDGSTFVLTLPVAPRTDSP